MVQFRPARESDQNYILDSFAKEYIKTPYCENVPYNTIRGLMWDMLASPKWQCTVMCESEVDDEIIGYVVHKSPHELAWLNLKPIYRGRGLSKDLLREIGTLDKDLPVMCAFLSPRILRVAVKEGLTLRFRPYLVFDK